jgi:acyl-coenzyme A thioesterase PaaI-like protein
MPESLKTRLFRYAFNFWPCYRGTGGRVAYIAADWREVRVKLPLNWRTRNYVGTTFGGSLYGSVDPFYMLMLIHILGPEYIVWDKAASIRFRKPGRGTLYATFRVDDIELQAIHSALASEPKVDRIYRVELADAQGEVHAEIEKTIYIRKKDTEVQQ